MAPHDNSGKSLKNLFARRESTIDLRAKPVLVITSVNSFPKSKCSLRYFCSVIWNSLTFGIREDHSIFPFLTKIRSVGRVGYIKVSQY